MSLKREQKWVYKIPRNYTKIVKSKKYHNHKDIYSFIQSLEYVTINNTLIRTN